MALICNCWCWVLATAVLPFAAAVGDEGPGHGVAVLAAMAGLKCRGGGSAGGRCGLGCHLLSLR